MGINYSISRDIEDENINEDITEISYEEGVGITRKDMEFNPILEKIDEESDHESYHESNTIVYPIIENNIENTKENRYIIDKYNIEIPLSKPLVIENNIKRSNSYNSLAKNMVDNIINEVTNKIILERSLEINHDKIKINELEIELALINEKYNELYINHKKTLTKYNRLKRKYKFD